jgi:hypothetical protein
VNRAQETVLVWSLAAAAKALLSPEAQIWLCVEIGAGDQAEAIDDLLPLLADNGAKLPDELSAPLWDWVSGFFGSDREARLRALLARLRVPEPPCARSPLPTSRQMPFGQRPRRVRHCPAGTASPARTAHRDPVILARPLRDNGLRVRAAAAATAGAEVLVIGSTPSRVSPPRRSAS